MDNKRIGRMPLTERTAQGPPPRRKMDGSKQRTYGKQGRSAALRAALKDNFIDENEIEEKFAGLTMQEKVPEIEVETVTREQTREETKKGKEVASRAPRLGKTRSKEAAVVLDASLVKYLQPLLIEAEQRNVISFTTWAKQLSKSFEFEKVAEGGFGEVYKLNEEKAASDKNRSILFGFGGCVLKIVPLKDQELNEEQYSTVVNTARECKVMKRMDELHGFTRFRKVDIVQGKYPDVLVKAFRKFKTEGGDCVNDDPKLFSKDQVYAIFEMGDAGLDLDKVERPSAFQIYDIFWSTVILIANAEEKVEFEHRDLHVGNICVKPFVAGDSFEVPDTVLSSMSETPKHILGLTGIRTAIIDYTLSRAAMSEDKSDVIYDPMEEESLFKAVGKGLEEKRQFRTYRAMRKCVEAALKEAYKSNRDVKLPQVPKWAQFVPQTNVIWLGYILFVLMKRAKERIVSRSSVFAADLQGKMYATLAVVSGILDGKEGELPRSANKFLETAQEKGWLTVEDIEAYKERLVNED